MRLKSSDPNINESWYSMPLVTITLLSLCFSMSLPLTDQVCTDVCPTAQNELENCPSCAVLVDLDSTAVAYFFHSVEQQTASIIAPTRSVAIPLSLEKRSRISRGPPFLLSTAFHS